MKAPRVSTWDKRRGNGLRPSSATWSCHQALQNRRGPRDMWVFKSVVTHAKEARWCYPKRGFDHGGPKRHNVLTGTPKIDIIQDIFGRSEME